MSRSSQISGYVLAGGESSRMQDGDVRVDKALLDFGDETLLERALRAVTAVCGNASILCGPQERCARLGSYGRTVPDIVERAGPLGALLAALEDAEHDWLLLMPVDLPLLPVGALRELADGAMDGGGPTVAVMSALERYQPLPVVLHRAAGPMVREALRRGDRKLMPVLREVAEAMSPLGISILPVDELTDEITGSVWFTNLNTPDDVRSAKEVARMSNELPRGASE